MGQQRASRTEDSRREQDLAVVLHVINCSPLIGPYPYSSGGAEVCAEIFLGPPSRSSRAGSLWEAASETPEKSNQIGNEHQYGNRGSNRWAEKEGYCTVKLQAPGSFCELTEQPSAPSYGFGKVGMYNIVQVVCETAGPRYSEAQVTTRSKNQANTKKAYPEQTFVTFG
jgi:hypothetical protein